MSIIIRDETPRDYEAITEITIAAFKPLGFPQLTEHFIIHALRRADAMTFSIVAEEAGRVIGHLAASPVTISNGEDGWFGLGPLCVAIDRQKQGIGSLLVEEALSRLEAMGARGCVLVGDPNYYQRFGFRSYPQLRHEGVPQPNVLALAFRGEVPEGFAQFHPAFLATE